MGSLLPPGTTDKAVVAAGVGAAYLLGSYVNNRLALTSDLSTISRLRKVQSLVEPHRTGQFSVVDKYNEIIKKHAKRTFILFEGVEWTYAKLDQEVNKMAHTLHGLGIGTDDAVAIVMDNHPDYLATMFASSKIGAVNSFINTGLRGKSLAHCIAVCKAKAMVVTSELVHILEDLLPQLQADNVKILVKGSKVPAWAISYDQVAASKPTTEAPEWRELRKSCAFLSTFSLVYTSGTTGMPKAAIVTHGRVYTAGVVVVVNYDYTQDDVAFLVLPMFHGNALQSSFAAFLAGAKIVLKPKFSVKTTMQDISVHGCTIFHYIGELCRYVLLQPPGPYDKKHKLRVIIGNGLRPDIWQEFATRFNIPRIGEIYGATEGNATATFFGYSAYPGKDPLGSVFRLGPLYKHLLPFEIVKFDVEKDEPYRTKEGFCIKVATGEPGELIGKVTDKSPFIGYHRDEKANNKKLLRDVFEKGDVYYRSGDLIKLDSQGYMFFVDRIGDTYRWKSENVATNEVMETMTSFPGGGVLEANVYGIQIPGIDGRAGMAAVLLRDDVHLGKLGEYLSAQLPHYAVPLFLRLLPKQDNKGMELTATFKYQKFSLREQGANPSIVKEPIVAFNPKTKSYEPFGQKDYDALVSGKARL